MDRSKITEMEAQLYEAVDNYRKNVDYLVESVNTRNAERVEEKKWDHRASGIRKQTVSLCILGGGTVVAFIFYKFILGIF